MNKKTWINNKVAKIMKEGVRRNTHKPVSSNNPRKPVSVFQASAIAHSMYKKVAKQKSKYGKKIYSKSSKSKRI